MLVALGPGLALGAGGGQEDPAALAVAEETADLQMLLPSASVSFRGNRSPGASVHLLSREGGSVAFWGVVWVSWHRGGQGGPSAVLGHFRRRSHSHLAAYRWTPDPFQLELLTVQWQCSRRRAVTFQGGAAGVRFFLEQVPICTWCTH